jgi:hypothetical protein
MSTDREKVRKTRVNLQCQYLRTHRGILFHKKFIVTNSGFRVFTAISRAQTAVDLVQVVIFPIASYFIRLHIFHQLDVVTYSINDIKSRFLLWHSTRGNGTPVAYLPCIQSIIWPIILVGMYLVAATKELLSKILKPIAMKIILQSKINDYFFESMKYTTSGGITAVMNVSSYSWWNILR